MNFELEAYTLSEIIINPEIAKIAFEKLEPKHFSQTDSHRELFTFIKNHAGVDPAVYVCQLGDLNQAYLTVQNNPYLGTYSERNIIELQREYLKDQYKIAKKNFDGDRAFKYYKRLQDTVVVDENALYTEETIRAEIQDASQNGLGIDVHKTGLIDEYYTPIRKHTTVITGIPSAGKSNFMDALSVRLAVKHGWKFLMFSPESQPLKLHLMNIAQKYTGLPVMGTQQNTAEVEEFITKHYEFINTNEIDHNIDLILALAKTKKLDAVVIDPWNEIEITQDVEHRFISESLSKIKTFSYKKNCHMFIVAHPTKLRKAQSGKYKDLYPVASAYDIDGSAKWYSKPDNIISLWRHPEKIEVEVHIQKIKYEGVTGNRGIKKLRFVPGVGAYVDDIIGE